MDNDFETLKEIFEMAELLNNEGNNSLELQLADEHNGRIANVVFRFNEDGELTGGSVVE